MASVLFYIFCAGSLSLLSLWGIDRICRVGPDPSAPSSVFFSGLAVILVCLATLMTMRGGTAHAFLGFAALWIAGLWSIYRLRLHREKTRRLAILEELAEDAAEVERALAKDPSNAAAWERLAEISEARGEFSQAAEHMKRACELDPSVRNRFRLDELSESRDEGPHAP